jgi:lysozyme
MDKNKILTLATVLIKSCEGFEPAPYLDSVKVPTIGYGTTYYRDGTRVTMSDSSISEQEALDLLSYKLETEFFPGILKTFHGSDVINSNQYAALLSFEYNEGVGGLAGSTLAKKLNVGDVQGAADEFPKWDVAEGHVLQGLLNRRLKERTLFLTAE